MFRFDTAFDRPSQRGVIGSLNIPTFKTGGLRFLPRLLQLFSLLERTESSLDPSAPFWFRHLKTHPDIVENHSCAQSVGRGIVAMIIPGEHRRGVVVARVVCCYPMEEFANFVHRRESIVRTVGQAPTNHSQNVGCQLPVMFLFRMRVY